LLSEFVFISARLAAFYKMPIHINTREHKRVFLFFFRLYQQNAVCLTNFYRHFLSISLFFASVQIKIQTANPTTLFKAFGIS
jgi:hypothetical protein